MFRNLWRKKVRFFVLQHWIVRDCGAMAMNYRCCCQLNQNFWGFSALNWNFRFYATCFVFIRDVLLLPAGLWRVRVNDRCGLMYLGLRQNFNFVLEAKLLLINKNYVEFFFKRNFINIKNLAKFFHICEYDRMIIVSKKVMLVVDLDEILVKVC